MKPRAIQQGNQKLRATQGNPKPTLQVKNFTHTHTAQVNNNLETQLGNVRNTVQYADTSPQKPLQLVHTKGLKYATDLPKPRISTILFL